MKRKYPIVYLPPAERDLEDIFDLIQRDSRARAASFLSKVDRLISRLALFPLSGRQPKDQFLRQKGYRILVIGNYLAFYRFEKRSVVFYRILHGKRRYEFLL